jgi:hypothetical protein
MAKPRPKTGEPRTTHQPLAIDALPPTVHEAIKYLRARAGLTWAEVERLSTLPYSKEWPGVGNGGFVDWDALEARVANKFTERRLPETTLARWYDLRVAQVMKDVMVRAEQARVIAESFAAAGVKDSDGAVLNAARDVIFGMLQSADDKSRGSAAKYLLGLADVMQEARKNAVRERAVAVDEQALQLKLDIIKQKAGKLIKTIEGGAADKPVQLTREQLLEQVKDIYGAV